MLERLTRSLALLGLAVTLLAALPAQGAEEADSEEGEQLYRRDCASCHGPAGKGSRRGPSLEEAGEAHNVYYLHTGRMPILSPEDPVERKPVPYTDEQLAALVAYAAGLGEGPDLPAVSTDGGELGPGGVDFRLHCAICHGAAGEGGALVEGDHAPSLMQATPAVMAAAMTAGPGAMPSFERVLESDQIDDIAAYVIHLQGPTGTGQKVGGGRVGEGLVGLAAALLLIAAARLIGDTE